MRQISHALLIGLALSLAMPGHAAAQHFPTDEELQVMLRYLVEDGETSGIVLGVLEPDGSTRVVSHGSGGPDSRPLGPNSVFDIGSVTKTFTSTLFADMVIRGEVALDDPVARYLPDSVTVPSLGGREITLLDLATHTSGLPRVADNYRMRDRGNPYANYSVETLYAFLSSHRLRRSPGAVYEYSNLGYSLLAHALGRAAGMSFKDLLEERVLKPLGMDQTGYGTEGVIGDWMVQGHRYGEAVPHYERNEILDGAGGLRSSAEDMLIFLKAQVGPPTTELERAMRMAQEVRGDSDRRGPKYGFSWTIGTTPGNPPMVTHGGNIAGFTARVAFLPDQGIGLAWMANSAEVAPRLQDLLLFDPPPAEWETVQVAPHILTLYAGAYEAVSGDGSYYIRLEEDSYLTYQAPGLTRARMYATSDTTFYILRGPWTFTFRTGPAEERIGMVAAVDDREPEVALERVSRKAGTDMPSPAVVAGNAGIGVAITAFLESVGWTVFGWGPVGWIALGLLIVGGAGLVGWRLFRWRLFRWRARVEPEG